MTKLDSSLSSGTHSPVSTGFRHGAAPATHQPTPETGLASLFASLMHALAPANTSGFGASPEHAKAPASDGTAHQEPTETTESPGQGTPALAQAAHQPVANSEAVPGQVLPGRGGDWTTQAASSPMAQAPRPVSHESLASTPNQALTRTVRDTDNMPQLPARHETVTATPARIQQSLEALLPASGKAHDPRSGGTTPNLTIGSQSPAATGGAEQRPDAIHSSSRPPAGAEWAPVKVNTQHAQWSRDLAAALGDRLNMQVSQNIKEASVRLDPPDLGRIELTVRLDGDRLNIQLNASNAHVRDMLSQHADRLRSDLMAQNTQTVDVQVGQQQQRGGSGQPQAEQETIAAALLRGEGETDTGNPEQPSDRWLSTSA